MPRLSILTVTLLVLAATFGCRGDESKPTPDEEEASETTGAEQEPAPELERPDFDDRSLPFRATGPVATVNGEDVEAERFNDAARRFGKMAKYLGRDRIERYKERIVTQLVRDVLTEQTLRKANVEIDEKAVEAEFGEFLEKNFHTEEDVKEYYRRTGTSPERLKADIRKSLALEKYLEEEYDTSVGEEEVKEYYAENTSRFQAPEQVHAAHILLSVPRGASDDVVKSQKKKAMKLAWRARRPKADFAKLARENSDGPRAEKGGDLGWFSHRQMVPEFSSAAFDLEPGKVSDPIRSSHGFHVIKVYERKPERIRPFEEAAEEIRDSLSRKRKRDATVKFMEAVREGAEIEQHYENIVDNPDFESTPPKGARPDSVTVPSKLD